jgi:RimJ/RimL family protein N-acetyltransferase
VAVEWPFFDLRLTCGDVLLRGVADADLDPLLALLPDDLEHDPRSERLAGLDDASDRRRLAAAYIWKHRGTWSPRSWCLDLVVEVEGEPVGVQALEGEDFPTLRTVDSFSWLATHVRGRGLANRMRACILTLAFEHLGAVAAVSSARTDNPASLAVSRRLGYVDNGLSRTDTPTGVTELQHERLTRDRWQPGRWPVEVAGLETARAWFGLSG